MVNYIIFLTTALLFSLKAKDQTTIIPYGASWAYSNQGQMPAASWKTAVIQADNWKTGLGIFRYGIKSAATQIGSDPQKKHMTTYFRKNITLADPARFRSYWAKIRRDNGAVVSINGQEVFRSNLPDGPDTYDLRASRPHDDTPVAQEFSIAPQHFVTGQNMIAVEVHQVNPVSADRTFGMELVASTELQPADTTPPRVMAIRRHIPAEKATNTKTLTFRISFSEAVKGLDAGDFTVTAEDGKVSGKIKVNAVKPANTDGFDVTVSGITGQGELRLDLKTSGTGIADLAGNNLVAGYTSGQSYSVSASQPAISDAALTRGPYLQMGSQTAVTLRWRTKKGENSQVKVGTRYGNYTLSFTDPKVSNQHEVRVTGLKPHTRYYYQIGSTARVLQSGTDNYFVTAPPPNYSGKVGIAVLGDCGKQNSEIQKNTLQSYRRHVGRNPAELLLLLGDNAYPDGTNEDYQLGFFNAYDSTILKNHMLFPAPGNHDYHTTTLVERTAPYYKIFTMPTLGESGGLASHSEAYYSFDWGNTHFISLDSHGTEMPANQRLSDTLAAQASWVKKDLEANTRPWVVVYWHHPPYSMGSHNSDTEDQLVEIRENFLRILERYGVDLVLTGHSHNYERSYLIKEHYGREASFSRSKHAVSTSSGQYNGTPNSCPYVKEKNKANQGIVYVVAGSAAQVGRNQESWPHKALPFSDNKGGMLYLEIENNRLDAKYLRSDGEVGDQFTILKGVNKTKDVPVDGTAPTRLMASWKGTYKWSTGETSRSIWVNPGSSTTYQVTDSQECLQDVFRVNVTRGIALKVPTAAQPFLSTQAAGEQIFPTLVSRGTSIQVRVPTREQVRAQVMDSNGRLISQGAFLTATAIETKGLPAGMYFLILQGKDYQKTQKFMVTD